MPPPSLGHGVAEGSGPAHGTTSADNCRPQRRASPASKTSNLTDTITRMRGKVLLAIAILLGGVTAACDDPGEDQADPAATFVGTTHPTTNFGGSGTPSGADAAFERDREARRQASDSSRPTGGAAAQSTSTTVPLPDTSLPRAPQRGDGVVPQHAPKTTPLAGQDAPQPVALPPSSDAFCRTFLAPLYDANALASDDLALWPRVKAVLAPADLRQRLRSSASVQAGPLLDQLFEMLDGYEWSDNPYNSPFRLLVSSCGQQK